MSRLQWKLVKLGNITTESKERAGDDSGLQRRPVYGVDRSTGLTSAAKYIGSSLERYKILEYGMFAYNPMRLNIGSIGYCSQDIKAGLVSPDYVVFECNPEKLSPDFLRYYIDSPYWKEWLQMQVSALCVREFITKNWRNILYGFLLSSSNVRLRRF